MWTLQLHKYGEFFRGKIFLNVWFHFGTFLGVFTKLALMMRIVWDVCYIALQIPSYLWFMRLWVSPRCLIFLITQVIPIIKEPWQTLYVSMFETAVWNNICSWSNRKRKLTKFKFSPPKGESMSRKTNSKSNEVLYFW